MWYLRALGAKVGRGTVIFSRHVPVCTDLLTIGPDTVIHDRQRLHHRGRPMVHYGVTMGDGAVLAPDSFLMKGEEIPQHARWGGNPAREMMT